MAMATLRRALDLPLAFRLLKKDAFNADRWNIAISPVSLHTALSLVLSTTESPTAGNSRERDNILSYLRSHNLPDLPNAAASSLAADAVFSGEENVPSVNRVSFYTSVLINESLLTASFLKLASLFFTRSGMQANIVRERANNWISITLGKGVSPELLPFESVGADTQMIICNSLFFLGYWDEMLSVSNNGSSVFYKLNGSTRQGPFMTSNPPLCIESYDGFKVLRLPYKKGKDVRQFAMYIFLPDARDGLWELEEKMSSDPEFVDRHIPKDETVIGELKVPVMAKGTVVSIALGVVWPPPVEMVDPEIPVDTFS